MPAIIERNTKNVISQRNVNLVKTEKDARIIITANTTKVVNEAPGRGVSLVKFKYIQLPSETPNGVNVLFTLSEGYISNTLTVYRDQLAMQGGGVDFTETSPTSGTFTMTVAPLTGEVVWCNYIAV